MELQELLAIISRSDGNYELPTIVDILASAYRSGVAPRAEHMIPILEPYPKDLAKLLWIAYERGLEPADAHFISLAPHTLAIKLIKFATSQALADAHRRPRYKMKWDAHVRPARRARDRSDLLCAAYTLGDIELCVSKHLQPDGVYLGWRALAAAYSAGLPPDESHVRKISSNDMQYTGLCEPRERAAVPAVLQAWIDAGLVDCLATCPVQWVANHQKKKRVLKKMYATGVEPLASHVDKYGVACASVVKVARRNFVTVDLMQRKYVDKRLPSELTSVIMRMIRGADRL